jgi:pimeloyl-ACP methyl ester carboxylesterase
MGPATEGPTRITRPLAVGDCAAWLHEAPGDIGLVLCSAWGFEEICMRRAWRMLADQAANAGYPTLRFDYPGTGDSLGEVDNPAGLSAFVDAAVAAADALREQAGVRRVVFAGQGLGAVVAAIAANGAHASGVALLAPPARGREHLRELCIWGAMVAEAMHIVLPHGFGEVAGFELPEPLRASISTINLVDLHRAPAAQALIAIRPRRGGEVRVASRLRDLGAEVTEIAYEGYDAALGNPTAARPPVALIGELVGWLRRTFPTQSYLRAVGPAPRPAVLRAAEFRERLVRIGREGLCGVLCEPSAPRRGSTVLMLSAGGDPHTGWARSNVEQARALARSGVASLRLDAFDVGDSPGPICDRPVKLYHQRPVQDARQAIEWLAAQGLGPVLVTGRCSGAFTAFNAALLDRRVAEVVLVNQRRFIWHGEGELEAAVDKVGHYKRQVRNPARLLVRWIRGELDLEAALARLGPAAMAVLVGALRGHRGGLNREIHDAFRDLSRRGVTLNLLYSRGGDAGADLKALFGPTLRGLRPYPNIRLNWLDGADHSLTPRQAREALVELLRDRALGRAPSGPEGAQYNAPRSPDLAPRPGFVEGAVAT